MVDTIKATPAPTAAPVATAPQTPNQEAPKIVEMPKLTPTPSSAELFKRIAESSTKKDATSSDTTTAQQEAPKVSVSLDDVKDPAARQILEKKLQEANLGISKTFGELGVEKQKYVKEAETLRRQLESATNQPWTPQRVQELLNRQDFVQAAQTLQATVAPNGWQGSQEDWSNLNQQEKAQFQNVVQETSLLRQQMGQMLQSQVDSQLKTKYPDYNPQEVDDFMRRAQANQLTPEEIREAVHLAKNAHRYIQQAYEFAMQDKTINLNEKLNGTTSIGSTGLNITPSSTTPERKPGERSGTHFSRVAWDNLQKLKAILPQKQ